MLMAARPCRRCGHRIPDGARMCPACGTGLSQNSGRTGTSPSQRGGGSAPHGLAGTSGHQTDRL